MKLKAAIIAALIILVVGTLALFAFRAIEPAITVNLTENQNSAAENSNANTTNTASLTPPAATGDVDVAVTAILSDSIEEQDVVADEDSAAVIKSDDDSIQALTTTYSESEF